jgi:DNA helicase-2/ATP-dependent DNA helicase PcrA
VTQPTSTSTKAAQDSVPGLEGDEAGSRVVREELRLFATVRRALEDANRPSALSAARETDDARLLELREEVAVAKPEDLPALFEQMHTVGAIRAQRGKSVAGFIDRQSPYFGHLRLEEGGKRRDILVGARSYVDGGSGIRIVDWRHAPVSRIFYRYQEGDDYDEELGGRVVEGRVLARRSVTIAGGELVRVGASEGIFVRLPDKVSWRRIESRDVKLVTPARAGAGDVPDARRRLGVGADGELRQDKLLPAIASMLDPEQFALITRPTAGVIAVQGSAGSGKTTVGLHRVAYLAFADEKRFRPERMLVVVPHEALLHYIARVLPSLGVAGVPVVTFSSYGRRLCAELLPKLPDQFTDETPPAVSRAKNHPAMLAAIERAVGRIAQAVDRRLREQMERWPEGGRVVQAWEATGVAGAVPDARVTALAGWLAGKRVLDGVGPASALPDVTRGALERLGHELRRETRDVVGAWDSIFTVRPHLDEALGAVMARAQLDRVFEWCVRRARLRTEGERDGDVPALDTEDVAILLRIWQLLRGPLADADGQPIRYAHVFIDEVQDSSLVELKVLMGLATKEQSITLAGDGAQRMGVDGASAGGDHGELAEFDWSEALRLLGVSGEGLAKVDALQVSYRSTAEITRFARAVLGPFAHAAEPIATRHGPPVELFTFSSPGEAVAWVGDALKQLARDEPYANAALIARFPQHADLYFEGLVRAEVPNVRRVARQDFQWTPGFDVTDVRQTKGLEFDEVVLLEASATAYPDEAAARHALYVATTRAAHQLWCISSDAPSPLVEKALEARGSPEDSAGGEADPARAR